MLAAVGLAQAQYGFKSWTTDAGLPQNTVYDILQTRDGYLWLTTFDGLVRFDGVRFTVFNKGNSPGISSNRFLRLYEDVRGDLWAGTEDGGVVRYHQGHFTSYGEEQGLLSLLALYMTEDADGHLLLFMTNSEEIVRWDGEKFQPFAQVRESIRHTTHGQLRTVPCWHNVDGIECLSYGRAGWSLADGLPSLNLIGNGAVEDGRGGLWMIFAEGGLVKIEGGRVSQVYTERNGLPGSPLRMVTGTHLSLLSRDKEGAVWLTNLESWQHQLLSKGTVPIQDLKDAKGYEDREGNLWFGTDREGLFLARKQFITTYSTADGLTQNNIYPIYQDREGVVWVGTTQGLFRFTGSAFTLEDPLTPGLVTAISEDQSGRLIVATSGQLWRREGGRFVSILNKSRGSIWAIYPDSDGSLWLGWELGLIHFKDGAEEIYTTENGLPGDDVKVIIGDREGGIWIGSYGGLAHYANGQFRSWTERDGLPSRTVRALYLDQGGVLWVGTYDGGMARLKDGKFTRYATEQGLFNNGVFQILEDARANFWMSSNRGIFRVSRAQLEELAEGRRASLTSIGYSKTDGMLNVECNGGRWPAGLKTRDGKLWFPTQDGVAVIDPAAVPTNPQPPPVRIESFLIDRAPADFAGGVQVQPDQENFEINYTALSYINPENMRFRYQLEGLDRDWVEAGTRRTAYYSHVPPGSYTFRVIAANSDGVWNTEGAFVVISIRPAFYQTFWFRSLIALGLLGLALAVYRMRVNRLERARRQQEEFSRKLLASQEQERQRIAAELHDSLGQSLLIIKNRAALARSDIEEREMVEEQLAELSHSATSAIEECREIAYNLRPYQISHFGLTKTLRAIFMRINEVTDIEAEAEVVEIDDLLTDEAQINVYRIVQECVNNIIKHSHAQHAGLFVKHGESEIVVLIEDDGRGFSQREPGANGNGRGGFGLLGISERVRILHGGYEIESEQGTRIRIKIPIAQTDDH